MHFQIGYMFQKERVAHTVPHVTFQRQKGRRGVHQSNIQRFCYIWQTGWGMLAYFWKYLLSFIFSVIFCFFFTEYIDAANVSSMCTPADWAHEVGILLFLKRKSPTFSDFIMHLECSTFPKNLIWVSNIP